VAFEGIHHDKQNRQDRQKDIGEQYRVNAEPSDP
jgi:hypothetical protein